MVFEVTAQTAKAAVIILFRPIGTSRDPIVTKIRAKCNTPSVTSEGYIFVGESIECAGEQTVQIGVSKRIIILEGVIIV
jgi:hypothetical protein